MGRGLRDLIKTMDEWKSKGIGFKSITEEIDTTTSTGNLVFQVFGALAEFERNLIVERTQAGLRPGRARGRVGGRPPLCTPEQKELVRKMHADKTIPLSTIAETFKISKQTIYTILNEDKKKLNA